MRLYPHHVQPRSSRLGPAGNRSAPYPQPCCHGNHSLPHRNEGWLNEGKSKREISPSNIGPSQKMVIHAMLNVSWNLYGHLPASGQFVGQLCPKYFTQKECKGFTWFDKLVIPVLTMPMNREGQYGAKTSAIWWWPCGLMDDWSTPEVENSDYGDVNCGVRSCSTFNFRGVFVWKEDLGHEKNWFRYIERSCNWNAKWCNQNAKLEPYHGICSNTGDGT